jgi:hypothetical protein
VESLEKVRDMVDRLLETLIPYAISTTWVTLAS